MQVTRTEANAVTMTLLASLASELLTGANLPFVAAFLLAVLFTVLSVMGLGNSEADADAGVETDAGHDLEVDHDVSFEADQDLEVGGDLDHDLDVDHDLDTEIGTVHGADHDAEIGTVPGADHDAEAGADHEVGVESASPVTLGDVLSFFGFGKVPLSILMMSFAYPFGLTGWLLNTLAAGPGGAVGSWFSVNLAGALAAGLASMRLTSRLIVRVMPTRNVSGFTRRQLVGTRGVVGLPVDERSGRANVVDAEGTRHQVRCRTVPGGKALPKGAKIIVVKYLPEDDVYYVAADRRR